MAQKSFQLAEVVIFTAAQAAKLQTFETLKRENYLILPTGRIKTYSPGIQGKVLQAFTSKKETEVALGRLLGGESLRNFSAEKAEVKIKESQKGGLWAHLEAPEEGARYGLAYLLRECLTEENNPHLKGVVFLHVSSTWRAPEARVLPADEAARARVPWYSGPLAGVETPVEDFLHWETGWAGEAHWASLKELRAGLPKEALKAILENHPEWILG